MNIKVAIWHRPGKHCKGDLYLSEKEMYLQLNYSLICRSFKG